MRSRNSKSSVLNSRHPLLIKSVVRLCQFVKTQRFHLLAALLHYLATATCGIILLAESWDRMLGEGQVAISEATFTFCHFAIGFCACNSLFLAFSPIWIPRVRAFFRQKRSTCSKSGHR